MKGKVIYKGKYGATLQYAEWLGQEFLLPVLPSEKLPLERLNDCDYIAIGSSVYIGNLLLKSWLRENAQILQNKKLFLFIVCATSASEREKQQQIIKDNIPLSLLSHCDIFFLPGRLARKKLSWKDRLLLNIGARLEKDPVRKQAMFHDIDGVRKENLAGLINAISQFSSGRTPSFFKTGMPA